MNRSVDEDAPEEPKENLLNDLLRDSVKALPFRMFLGLVVLGTIYFVFAPKETRPDPRARRAAAPAPPRTHRFPLGTLASGDLRFDLEIEVEGGAPDRRPPLAAARAALAEAAPVEGEDAAAVLALRKILRAPIEAALPERIHLVEIYFGNVKRE